jgi:ElaA protein
MNLELKWYRLDSLTAREMHELIKARESVFVVEQRCVYQEADDMDLASWHLRVLANGELAAYARVVDPHAKYTEPSIGRVMTLQKFRGLNLGRTLMQEAIRFTHATFPSAGIRISAQLYLQAFYESLGFVAVTAPYDEDGIPHITMTMSAKNELPANSAHGS